MNILTTYRVLSSPRPEKLALCSTANLFSCNVLCYKSNEKMILK